jgi:hypothetical protein
VYEGVQHGCSEEQVTHLREFIESTVGTPEDTVSKGSGNGKQKGKGKSKAE